MDVKRVHSAMMEFAKKYRWVILILVVGVLLMLLPSKKEEAKAVVEAETQYDYTTGRISEEALEDIISEIRGVGKAKVLLTLSSGEKNVYQTDSEASLSDTGSKETGETVLITSSDRTEQALLVQILGPEYLGAVVVCQGADDPAVRLAVTEAVSKATGLGANRISVLRMK